MKMYFLLSLLLMLSIVKPAVAEIVHGAKYRLFGGYSLIRQTNNSDSVPQIISPYPNFPENSDGKGYFFGLSYELPLPHRLYIGLKISSSIFNTEMKTTESGEVFYDKTPVLGKIDRKIESDFSTIKFNSYLKYYLIDGLAINFGGYFAPFLSQKYTFSETIKSPAGAVFPDNNHKHSIKNQQYTGKKGITSGIDFGISYDIPLNKSKTLFVTPELDYFAGLNDIFDYADWKISSADASLSFTYSPKTKKKKETTAKLIKQRDTLVIERPDILYTEFHKGKTDTAFATEETPDSVFNICTIRNTDTLYTKQVQKICLSLSSDSINLSPKIVTSVFRNLNRIYFIPDTDSILDIYCRITDSLSYTTDLMAAHRQTLQNIRRQLLDSPNSVIKLKSALTGINMDLARRQVKTVKRLLTNAGISPDRIAEINDTKKINTVTVPDSLTAEMYYVEILSDNPDILATQTYVFKEFNPIPQSITIKTAGTKIHSPKQISLIASQADNIIAKETFDSLPESYVIDSQKLINMPDKSINTDQPIEITLSVKSANGDIATESKNLYIKSSAPDSIYRLSLFVFNFADTTIPELQRREIAQFITNAPNDAKVRIFGFCDKTGDKEFNELLSLQRATNAKKVILSLRPDLNIISLKGYGYDKFPPGITSYLTAPEKVLSRTVILEICK